jgi:hypothetical protein
MSDPDRSAVAVSNTRNMAAALWAGVNNFSGAMPA